MNIKQRIECLKSIKNTIKTSEKNINKALYEDLNKSPFESFFTELSMIYSEIDFFVNNLAKIAANKSLRVPWVLSPGKACIEYVPKGKVLIISPWNYPFQLSLVPLIASVAAGNSSLIKPSEHAPRSSEVLLDIVLKLQEKWPIKAISGDQKTVDKLLEHRFDHIFYTGSTQGGRAIMEKAARHLTPVTLELGGKSPCIIDETADLAISARRIMWGKCLNAGQTCIAPDYILIKKNLINNFIKEIKNYLTKHNQDYGKIINEYHTTRLSKYLSHGQIIIGGKYDIKNRFIEPSIMADINPESPLLREEIFGPILPIITYENLEEAIKFINNLSSPLVIYIFSQNKHNINHIKKTCLSGSISINDVISFLAIPNLPFGGAGLSGMGRYHGAAGFYELSHIRPCYERSNHLDLNMRYPPYPAWVQKLFRKLL